MDSDDDFSATELIDGHLHARNRPLRMVVGFPDGVFDHRLLPQRISGTEAICEGIELRIDCVASNAGIALKTLIGLPVEIQLVTDRGTLRSMCGIVAEARQGESDGALATYQLVLRDGLALLDLGSNTRTFLGKSELDVIRTVLAEVRRDNPALAACFDVEIETTLGLADFPARQQIIQYNEGNGAFLRRLMKRRGICWLIRAGRAGASSAPAAGSQSQAPCHTLVLFHDALRLPRNAASNVRFHRDSATEQRDTITAWGGVRTLQPGGVSRHSWDYNNPQGGGFLGVSALSQVGQGPRGDRLASNFEHYLVEAPHVGDSFDDLASLTQRAMARSDFESKCFYGEAGVRDLCVGEWIAIDGHAELDTHGEQERQFLILSQQIRAQNNLPKQLDARVDRLFARNRWQADMHGVPLAGQNWFDSNTLRFESRFTCVRRGVRIVPAYDPRSDVPHPHMQSAMVVGPLGEEVHCDDQGRVKVRFPGMRARDHAHAEGAGASDSDVDSAWIRVASGWSGNIAGSARHYGNLTLPRIGTEVLVAFMGGDPDKPVIVGQVYNATARPPCLGVGDLPGNKYLSGMKSREIRGARGNQLRFDDTHGQISAQLASEHGTSQLNLGWLSQPRNQGAGVPRGEGAELRSDEQLALRGGKGVLLSAWRRLEANGKQMERSECLALMEDCVALFRSLGKYAAENQALPVDDQAHDAMQAVMKQWEGGTNTDPKGIGGASPAIAVTAPDGISFTTAKSIVSYAAANIDTVSQQHLQLTAGQRFNLNAGKGISLFSHHDGLQAIAHFGKMLLQSQHDDIDINAAKTIRLTATEGKLVGMANTIELICEDGSFIRLGDGITFGSSKPLKFSAPRFVFGKPETLATQLPIFGGGQVDEKFITRYRGGTFGASTAGTTSAPDRNDAAPNQHMDVSLSDGSRVQEISDAVGTGKTIKRDAMHIAEITIFSKKD